MLADLARRDGQRVVAFDLFGDLDLRGREPRRDAVGAGGGGLSALVDAAATEAPSGVVYGASFENHPALVARLAERHALLGNTPETLRAVATRAARRRAARRRASVPATFAAAPDERAGRWLRKPLRGGGGTRVRDWRGGALPPGRSCRSASTASRAPPRRSATGGRGRARAHRAARRRARVRGPRLPLVREHLPAAAAGGRAEALWVRRARSARTWRRRSGCGGCSASTSSGTASARGRIEVNPRPTASLEAIEAAYGVAVFDAHLRPAPVSCRASSPACRAAGKAVLFATEAVTIGDSERWLERGVRDVPHPGERIAAGHPICTLVAAATTPQRAWQALEEQAARLRAELRAWR